MRNYFAAAILTAAIIFIPMTPGVAHLASRHTHSFALEGKALDVGISSGGVTYVIDPNGRAWRWGSSFGEEWSFAGGNRFVRIDVDPDGRPWAVDRAGGIYFYNTVYWEKRGKGAVDIGIGPSGVVLALLKNGRVAGWKPGTRSFERFLERKGRRIDVDAQGRPWIIDDDGHLAHHNGKVWSVFDTKARDVSIAPDGSVFVIRENGMAALHLSPSVFQDIAGFTRAHSLSAGPEGHLWAIREDRTILSMSLFEEERGVETPQGADGPARLTMEQILDNQRRRRSSVDTAIITSNAPLEFVLVPGIDAFDVGIGADGSVFASNTDGFFKQFSERQHLFLDFPGQIEAVAVDADGNPWGVTPSGEVFRHNGRDWQQRTGQFETAADIAINNKNQVFITDIRERVFQFDEKTEKFLRFPRLEGFRIAVDPKGKPWTIDREGVVFRCDMEPDCIPTTAPKAQDIGIGPDGSIFITSTNNDLLRYNRRDEKFEFLPRIGTGVRTVDVGPRGRPWVIDVNDRVFAAGFFPRNENDDADKVKTTRTETSDVPTIVFKKSLNLPRYTNVRRRIPNADTVRASRNGEVIVATSDGIVWRFNRSKKRFEQENLAVPLIAQSSGPPVPINAIAPEGEVVYMAADVGASTTTYTIFRQSTFGRAGAKFVTDITLANDNVDARIHVGPDAVLYFTIVENTPGRSRIFVMPPNESVLTEIDLARAGVDPIENFLTLSGGGREGELDNSFENVRSGKTTIQVLSFDRGRGKITNQVLRSGKFEKVYDTTRDITTFTGNEKNFYTCIDQILHKRNKNSKRFDRTNIECTNIAVTPEELVFYIVP